MRVCAGLVLLGLAGTTSLAAAAGARGDIRIQGTDIYPESITSTAAGAVITGSVKGIIYRAKPGQSLATPWIHIGAKPGQRSVFGVLADERSHTLWACTMPNPFHHPAGKGKKPGVAALMAFDLTTGRRKARYAFPPPAGVCNDIAVAADGTVYVSDTPNGRILQLTPGATSLAPFGRDKRLKGIEGLAFSGSGVLYGVVVSPGALWRIGVAHGRMGRLQAVKLSRTIDGPDGFRPLGGNRFVLAEGYGGRIDEVTIHGDAATVRVLRSGFLSPPGVTLVGHTVYAIDGKIGYLINPKLKGRDPGPFKAYAIPLP